MREKYKQINLPQVWMHIFLENFSGVCAQSSGVYSSGRIFLNPQSHIQTNSA